MYGYNGKMLFVDLTSGRMEDRALEKETAQNFIGGPALGAKVLYENMPAKADVFGEESMVGFVSGPLNNTGALFGGRYTVVSKSPVTGGWNDTNSGGYFGASLKKSGYDAVFVKGIAASPVYIFIDNGKAQILDASEIWGKNTMDTEKWLRARHGADINAALIGRSGEKMSLLACVMNDSHRAAGRGGSGAVIGSKKLKAVVVKGNARTEVFSREELVASNKAIAGIMKEGPGAGVAGAFGTMGTGVGFVSSILSGDAGIKNWSGAGVTDYPESVGAPVGGVGLEPFKTKKYNCSSCPLGCGAFLNIPDKRWDLSDSPRPEYETQGSFGSNLLNGDPASVCRCNDLCNEYGVDTISTGGTIAWAMECYNEGVLTKEDLDGIELTWGNGDAIVAICEKICENEGIGAVLAKGSREASRILGKGEEFLVTASGMEEPMHDSRLAWGLTRTYQYDPTPGRHVKGGLGIVPSLEGFDYAATGEADKNGVIGNEITNASGLCLFGSLLFGLDIGRHLRAVTGFDYSQKEFANLGLRSFTYRHAFNLREGMDRKSFTLSPRLTKSPPPQTGPLAGITVDNERLADNFFEALHWDKSTLYPARETLEEIGACEPIIRDLYGS